MVPLLYVYVGKNCLQCKKDDEEVYVYVYVSVSECSRVVKLYVKLEINKYH